MLLREVNRLRNVLDIHGIALDGEMLREPEDDMLLAQL
jgi:hypothetical protein